MAKIKGEDELTATLIKVLQRVSIDEVSPAMVAAAMGAALAALLEEKGAYLSEDHL